MDMPLNLIVLEQRGKERGSKGEKKGSVWAEAPSTVSFIWNNPDTLPNWKLYQKKIKKIISFCPPSRPFFLQHWGDSRDSLSSSPPSETEG